MTTGLRSRAPGIPLCVVIVAALAILALALPAAGQAVVNIEGVTPEQLPDYDSRASVAPSADQLAAAMATGADVKWNRFGVASSVSNLGNYVAKGLQAPDAVSAARQWLEANKTLFKLDSTDSLAVATSQPFVGTTNDYAVVFKQVVDGVLSTDGVATVALVGSKNAGWDVTYASSSLSGGSTEATGDVELGPAEAWTEAANNVGVDVSVLDIASLSTKAGSTTLDVRGISQAQNVKKSVFATPHHGGRAAYTATVTTNANGDLQSYQVVLDAETGRVLYRESQVDYLTDNPTWKAPEHSGPYNALNAFPWNYPVTDNRIVFCWTATAGCTSVKGDDPATNTYPGGIASKQPWDVQATSAGFTGTANTTWGNNVDDARVWNSSDVHNAAAYGSATLTRATSATRDYQPAFTDAWYVSGCDPSNVNPAVNPLGNDIEASTVSLFVGHNVMHDWAYYLGFDEGHWNAQQFNNGVTVNDPSPTPGGPTIAAPLANDGLLGNAQSGAASGSRDNANMNTGADGLHPTTNQFVWQPLAGSFYAPCVDGAYDFGVFGHEFGHMIENRMIAKGVGTRQGTHAGSMGEAFGDFDALAAFNELHLPVPPGSDRYTEGAYATGNGYNGIRDFLAGRPMGGEFPEPSKNADTDPLNYGNFGFDIVGTEVHADGEIWVAIQMDLRDLFLARNPSPGADTDIACAHGRILPQNCPGDRQWIQDYYDAMVLMPRNTTMIQARDAMLAADLGRFGGANMDLLWQGFAMRGFGLHQNTVSNGDANPVPDFSMPATTGAGDSVQLPANATINFTAVTGDGKNAVPVNARIFVGDFEARSTQIADTDAATVATGTDATGNLDNTAQFAPNAPGKESLLPKGKERERWWTYNFVAVAPGYGHLRFWVRDLKPGEVRDITIRMPTNYASAAQGATITTDAPATGTNVNPQNIIDDLEGTSTTQSCTPTATCLVPVNGRWVVIALGAGAATNPVKIDRLGVSAMFSSRFVGLRSFDAYSCNLGKNVDNPTCDGSIDAGWSKIIAGASDSFPGVNPRPGTQDESLRYFDAKPKIAATHLKFVVTNNQCTGQPSFQGDQDLDPNNNSECRVGIRRSEVHTAEVEVFADKPKVEGKNLRVG